jgi:hypothetical protein
MRERYGSHFRKLGVAGVGVLLLAFVSTGVAFANGVHCPECARHSLTDPQFAFWQNYFVAKNGVYVAAAVLLAAASPFATPRRWPFVFGFLIALFSFSVTPL